MDDIRFDRLTAVFATANTRRRLLGALLGTTFANLVGRPETEARPRRPNCPPGQRRCGNDCCTPDETCRRGQCKHRCEDGIKNRGESATDCGRVCAGVLAPSPAGLCRAHQRCAGGEDCRSGFCEEVEPGTNTVCADCQIDSHCQAQFADQRSRCLDHFCFECAADFDCEGRFDPPEPKCIELSVASGLNEIPCPPGQACVCRECSEDAHCPPERPRCRISRRRNNPTDGACIECLTNRDCPPERPHCQDESCLECLQDRHCPEGHLCDEQGRCEELCPGPQRRGVRAQADTCPDACNNGVQDGDETGTDCGGSCPPCPTDEFCLVDGDCQSGCCAGGGGGSFGICAELGTINSCASCGDFCPGQFPSCVRCCGGQCMEFSRDGNPECDCP
jgi:hypothetical protein